MRKLIVCTLMSLDGYVAGPGGNVMVLPLDHSFSEYNLARLRTADTLVLGAITYRGFLAYWPTVETDTQQPPTEREISALNNRIAKVLVSDSLTPEETGPWRETTEIVRRRDAHARIAELKQAEGDDILTFGSATLWNDLLGAGLVDELHLTVGAGAIGSGEPAFRSAFGGQAFDGDLDLTEVRQLDGSPNVLLRYSVTNSAT